MLISTRFLEAHKTICHLEIPDDLREEALLHSVVVQDKENQFATIKSKLTYLPGLCLLDATVQVHQQLTEEVLLAGAHIRLLFSLEGNSHILDVEKKCSSEAYAGVLRRQYQQQAQWQVTMPANQQVRYVAIILSRAYAENLFRHEPWRVQDGFLEHLFNDQPLNTQEEQFFITLPVQKVLHELLNTDYSDLTRKYFIQLKLKELFFVLHKQPDVSFSSRHFAPEVYKKLVKAKALLLSRLNEPPTTKQLSRLVALNELRLKQDFKALYGTTIHAYIIACRMKRAQELLQENCSVNDMSARLGYRSVSHFIQTFKKYFGETPKQALSRSSKVVTTTVGEAANAGI
ncbi:helix-turn-helix transcriptional regulator [Pontibacter qinzhouensis]|uniref:Helix-turn-helix transcriptional regulator n=1 Tax=Pontibacter qinzhouensis TaxID=2603253 RepID=A0A5C8J7V8_9BACT|nr:helix-turn-helix transcriptional regulator [Pontibacter qinzhouensis]TXK33293.1 helix-turn-helix transcriptional regulator [Pontibacter qinzhouensis]